MAAEEPKRSKNERRQSKLDAGQGDEGSEWSGCMQWVAKKVSFAVVLSLSRVLQLMTARAIK
jgi:hypothetical protein